MTAKVPLIRERAGEWFLRNSKPLRTALPFFEREGSVYVHRVRSGHMHYCPTTGKYKHSSVTFWCDSVGILSQKKGRGRKPCALVSEPSLGRTVCATCEGRAIGSGQLGAHKIGPHIVRYRPHGDFFSSRRTESAP